MNADRLSRWGFLSVLLHNNPFVISCPDNSDKLLLWILKKKHAHFIQCKKKQKNKNKKSYSQQWTLFFLNQTSHFLVAFISAEMRASMQTKCNNK